MKCVSDSPPLFELGGLSVLTWKCFSCVLDVLCSEPNAVICAPQEAITTGNSYSRGNSPSNHLVSTWPHPMDASSAIQGMATSLNSPVFFTTSSVCLFDTLCLSVWVCLASHCLVLPQAMSLHHRFPPGHVEPGLVCVHHPHGPAQLHGGEGSHPGLHRDLRLHGEHPHSEEDEPRGVGVEWRWSLICFCFFF